METLPPYRELAERAGSIADHRALAEPGKVDLCGYDYVLLLEAGGEPDLAHFAADRLLLLVAVGHRGAVPRQAVGLRVAEVPRGVGFSTVTSTTPRTIIAPPS